MWFWCASERLPDDLDGSEPRSELESNVSVKQVVVIEPCEP